MHGYDHEYIIHKLKYDMPKLGSVFEIKDNIFICKIIPNT